MWRVMLEERQILSLESSLENIIKDVILLLLSPN